MNVGFAVVVRLVVLSAVLSLASSCAPSVKPQMKEATDRMLQEARGTHDEPSPSSYDPKPWQQGQWVQWRSVDKNGQPSVSKLSVVEEGEDGIWLEQVHQDYRGRTVTKVLYSRMPKTPEEATEVVQKIISKRDDEEPRVMDLNDPSGPGGMMRGMTKAMMPSITWPRSPGALPKEDVTVAGGTFRGTVKFPSSVQAGPFQMRLTGWYHPAVPLGGSVKSQSDDGSATTELLGYGDSGARSELDLR